MSGWHRTNSATASASRLQPADTPIAFKVFAMPGLTVAETPGAGRKSGGNRTADQGRGHARKILEAVRFDFDEQIKEFRRGGLLRPAPFGRPWYSPQPGRSRVFPGGHPLAVVSDRMPALLHRIRCDSVAHAERNPHPTADPLLTEGEAARLLALSIRTLQAWRTTGRGPAFVRAGRAVRYTRRGLAEWVEACTVSSTDTGRGEVGR